MLFASRLWMALGLLVVGAKDSYGSAIHDSHYPNCDTSSGSTATRTMKQAIPSYTSTSWHSNRTIGTTTTLYVLSSKTITTSIPTKPNTTWLTTSSSTTTTTTYVPMTITSSPAPPPNPCPTYCTISAGTVNLFYWPTNEPYTYPSTYVDTALDYTFTSPSVYMVVNTIFGYNSAGLAGPSGTSVVFALDLDQVSTIVPGVSATQQLTLSDLGTDCPQSEAASVIATAAPDGRCDPILVAPNPVKSWALPCNACGRFGLFDPPYAVPPLAGGLVPATTTAHPQPQTTPSAAPAANTTTTSADANATSTTLPMETASSATRVTGGLACLILSLLASVCLL